MKWYHFDPFKHIPKEQCTVGALRAQAEGHDVSIQALSHHQSSAEDKLAAWEQQIQAAAAQQS